MDLAKKCQGRYPRHIPLSKDSRNLTKGPQKDSANSIIATSLSNCLGDRLMCVDIERPDVKASRNDSGAKHNLRFIGYFKYK